MAAHNQQFEEANTLIEVQRFDEAKHLLRGMVRTEQPEATLLYGRLLLTMHEFSEAELFIENLALARQPVAFCLWGRLLHTLGLADLLKSYWDGLPPWLASEPDCLAIAQPLAPAESSAVSDALTEPSSSPSTSSFAEDLVVAQRALRDGDMVRLDEYLKRAASVSPDHHSVLDLEMIQHFRLGRFSDSSRIAARLLNLIPEHSRAHYYLGACAMKVGFKGEALSRFRRAFEVERTREAYFRAYFSTALRSGRILTAMTLPGKYAKIMASMEAKTHRIAATASSLSGDL